MFLLLNSECQFITFLRTYRGLISTKCQLHIVQILLLILVQNAYRFYIPGLIIVFQLKSGSDQTYM